MTQRTIEKLDSPYPPPFSKALLKPRHWPTWIGLGLLWILIKLPRGIRAALGDWLGAQTFKRNRKRAAIVRTNLAWCYPEKSDEEREALARSYFRNMAHAMLYSRHSGLSRILLKKDFRPAGMTTTSFLIIYLYPAVFQVPSVHHSR